MMEMHGGATVSRRCFPPIFLLCVSVLAAFA